MKPMEELIIVSDYAGHLLAKKVADQIGCKYVPFNSKYFPDGEIDPQLSDNVRGHEVYYFCPYWPDPLQRDTEIKFLNSTLKYSSAGKIFSVPTYLGFMKKDWKDRPRVPISIREVAVGTMEPYVNHLLTIEMHSAQIQGMFRIPSDNLDGTVLFAPHIKKHFDLSRSIVVAPDLGATKRAKTLAERLGLREFAIVYKMRDPRTGEVTAEGVFGDVDGKTCILVDDQAVTLSSQVEASKLLREHGAEDIHSYTTHGLMVDGTDEISAEQRLSDSLIERLYITDTIPRPDSYFEKHSDRIELISSVDLFANVVKTTFEGGSLTAYFDTSNSHS